MITTPASVIINAANKQTDYTIRFLVDRERVDDAYRAYGYFRMVDDALNAGSMTDVKRIAFIQRQLANPHPWACRRISYPRQIPSEQVGESKIHYLRGMI